MEALFLKLLNMSITASWLVLAVILFRLLFKKAPKWIGVALWALVGVRLICPFSFESLWSLIPSAETIPPETLNTGDPMITSGISVINSTVNPILNSFEPTPAAGIHPWQVAVRLASLLWIIGMIAMMFYTVISYIRIRLRTREAIQWEGKVWLCDRISSPFILGVFKPRIYLPSSMDEGDVEYVIAHENAHLKRRDHWWKPFGFLLLTVYWFNPVLWVAYILLCRDIEFACDEKVLKEMGTEVKKPYSEALINCSVSHRTIAACPLAFGEIGVKGRIKSVLNYKKPAFWIVLSAVVISVAVAVCFLTDPIDRDIPRVVHSYSELDGVSISIRDLETEGLSPYIEIEWKNETDQKVVCGESFEMLHQVTDGWEPCAMVNMSFNAVGYTVDEKGYVHRYSLAYQDMSEAGIYRFESSCNVLGKSYTLRLEFELEEGFVTTSFREFEVVEVYEFSDTDAQGTAYGSVPYYSQFSHFRAVNIAGGLNLQRSSDSSFSSGPWLEVGHMQETVLTKENFDDRFHNQENWYVQTNVKTLREANTRAWELRLSDDKNVDLLYMLLEQENGAYYLVQGYYGGERENADGSGFRYLYQLSDIGTDYDGLNYETTIDSVRTMNFVSAIHYPGDSDEGNSSIEIRGTTGEDLAEYLETRDWRACSAPWGELSSPESVEFIIEEDYRITIYKRVLSYAVVSYGDEVRYYRADRKDYEDAVAILTDAMGPIEPGVENATDPYIKVQYAGDYLVYDRADYSSGFYTIPQFVVTTDQHFGTNDWPMHPTIWSHWYDVGQLEEIELNGKNFDALLTVETWMNGHTADSLRQHNETAWFVADEENQRMYYLLHQKNGDVFVAFGYPEESVIRQIYKVVSVEIDVPKADEPAEFSGVTMLYQYNDSVDPLSPSLQLNGDGTFRFVYSGFSSYVGFGSYTREGNTLTCKTDDNLYTYVFCLNGDTLTFDAARSSKIPEYRYSGASSETQCPVPNGAVFVLSQ